MAYQPDVRELNVVVHRAGAIGQSHVPTLMIVAHEEFPRDEDAETCRRIHNDDAERIVDALVECLAGGTLNQILIRLLERHRSELIVAAEPLSRMNT